MSIKKGKKNIELTNVKKVPEKVEEKKKEQTDLEYMEKTKTFVDSKLEGMRYGLKEVKHSITLAEAVNTPVSHVRFNQLQEERRKILGFIKEAMADQKHVNSIYKKIKELEVKKK